MSDQRVRATLRSSVDTSSPCRHWDSSRSRSLDSDPVTLCMTSTTKASASWTDPCGWSTKLACISLHRLPSSWRASAESSGSATGGCGGGLARPGFRLRTWCWCRPNACLHVVRIRACLDI